VGVKLLLPRCFNKCEDGFFLCVLNLSFPLFLLSIEVLSYVATISSAEKNRIEKGTIKTLSLMIHLATFDLYNFFFVSFFFSPPSASLWFVCVQVSSSQKKPA
jgi:hypothetical protein